jgi:hypothetical protein
LLGRLIATAAVLVAVIAAVGLIGYGVLLWVAIPSSDTATSSLFLVGLALVAAGAGLALLGWLLLRWGPLSDRRRRREDASPVQKPRA